MHLFFFIKYSPWVVRNVGQVAKQGLQQIAAKRTWKCYSQILKSLNVTSSLSIHMFSKSQTRLITVKHCNGKYCAFVPLRLAYTFTGIEDPPLVPLSLTHFPDVFVSFCCWSKFPIKSMTTDVVTVFASLSMRRAVIFFFPWHLRLLRVRTWYKTDRVERRIPLINGYVMNFIVHNIVNIKLPFYM